VLLLVDDIVNEKYITGSIALCPSVYTAWSKSCYRVTGPYRLRVQFVFLTKKYTFSAG
jgi:hypothetical protein